jgi:hypothetical protein
VPDLKGIFILLASKVFSWTGKKPRERLLLLIEQVFQCLKKAIESSRAFIVSNYFKLYNFALFYSIFGFSIITVSLLYLGINSLVAIITLIPIVVPLLSEFSWSHIVNGNPRGYLAALELKSRGYWKYLVIIIFGYFFSILLLSLSFSLKNADLIVSLLIVYVLITYAFVGFVIFLASIYIVGIYAVRRNPVTFLKIICKLYLSKVTEEKELKKQISAFTVGLSYLNEYMKWKFKLGLVNQSRCRNFFKFSITFGGEKEQNKVQLAVQNLILLLGKESEHQTELSNLMSTVGDLMGKPLNRFEDLFEELDFEGSLSKIVKNPYIGTILGIVGVAPIIYTLIQVLISLSSGSPIRFP